MADSLRGRGVADPAAGKALMAAQQTPVLDAMGTPFPPYVLTEAERERWNLATQIAHKLGELYEADSGWVWMAARSIYRNPEIPTGMPGDGAVAEAELLGVGVELAEVAVAVRAQDMLAELERLKPDDDASEEEAWAHVGRVCDILDELFGNPDDLDVGPYEGAIPEPHEGHPADVLADLAEAFVPYSAALHPKDRIGRWAAKLNGLRAHVAENREKVRQEVGMRLAARRLGHDVRRAHKPGGAFHGDPAHARARHPNEFAGHAAEERARHGVSGAKRKAIAAKTQGAGRALTALAYVYTAEGEKKLGPLSDVPKDAPAAVDRIDQAHAVKHLAHEVARYAIENHDQIRTVAHVVGHAARLVVGAAEVTDDDEASAELMLAESFDGLAAP